MNDTVCRTRKAARAYLPTKSGLAVLREVPIAANGVATTVEHGGDNCAAPIMLLIEPQRRTYQKNRCIYLDALDMLRKLLPCGPSYVKISEQSTYLVILIE